MYRPTAFRAGARAGEPVPKNKGLSVSSPWPGNARVGIGVREWGRGASARREKLT
jgi:hypothetical protein